MRYQGKLTSWKDDQGFGFIAPNDGSTPVFLHIKALHRQSSRPIEGDLITYELEFDERKRPRARAALRVGERIRQDTTARVNGRGWKAPAAGWLFCLGLVAAVGLGALPAKVPGIYAVVSLATFMSYWLDKSAAQAGGWRTPESTLHLLALAGGWPGALVAQRLLRHKSIKPEFRMVFWGTVILNCAILAWLFTAKGRSFLDAMTGIVA